MHLSVWREALGSIESDRLDFCSFDLLEDILFLFESFVVTVRR